MKVPAFLARPFRLGCVLSVLTVLVPTLMASAEDKAKDRHAIPYVEGIVVDGEGRDWNDQGFQVEVLSRRDGTIQEKADFRPQFRIGWNKNGLLVFAEVHDDSAAEMAGTKQWEADSVELFFAAGPELNQIVQLIINPGIEEGVEKTASVFDFRTDKTKTFEVESAAAKMTEGYSVEVLIPWTAFGVEPQEGMALAGNVQANDMDRNGVAEKIQHTWYPSGWSGRGASAMHPLRLEKQSGVPVRIASSSTPSPDFRTQNFLAVAAPEFAGKGFSVEWDGKLVGTAILEMERGWAVARLSVPLLASSEFGNSAAPDFIVKVDGNVTGEFPVEKVADARRQAVMDAPLECEAVFSGDSFPAIKFQTPGWIATILGEHTLTLEYYDANYNKVTHPEKPGRYGAVMTIQREGAEPVYRYLTLYRTAEPVDWKQYQAGPMVLPQGTGIKEESQKAYPALITGELQQFLSYQMKATPAGAVVLAGLSAADLRNGPAVDRTSGWMRDADWWFGLRKAIGQYQARYLIDLPEGYENAVGEDETEAAKWPLVIFLHGAGERGTDIERVRRHGLPKLAAKGKQFPFILVTPQCDIGEFWNPAKVIDVVNEVTAKYRVDETRVYLTGFSMGGSGTWRTALAFPEHFAAIAPVCGRTDPSDAARLVNVPVWVFHGEDDLLTPLKESQDMVDAIKNAGGTAAELTAFPAVGHNAWDPAYNDERLYEWFLANKLGNEAVRSDVMSAP